MDIARQIADLKERRAQVWQSLLPDDVNDLDAQVARLEVVKAENHPDVVALDTEIKALRARQQEG